MNDSNKIKETSNKINGRKWGNKDIIKGILVENFSGFNWCDDGLEGILDMIDQDWVKEDFCWVDIEIEEEDLENLGTKEYEFDDWDTLKDFLYEHRMHLIVDDVWVAGDSTVLGFTMHKVA